MSGLRATQASLALVSSNVANAETPGYVKKRSTSRGTTGERVERFCSHASTAAESVFAAHAHGDLREASSIPFDLLQICQNFYGNPLNRHNRGLVQS